MTLYYTPSYKSPPFFRIESDHARRRLKVNLRGFLGSTSGDAHANIWFGVPPERISPRHTRNAP